MKILLSGATGFIGAHLLEKLLEKNHELYAIVRDSTSTENLPRKVHTFVYRDGPGSLSEFMEKERFDGVIHLASLYLAKHEMSDIKKLIDSNIIFGTELLEAASKNKVTWFINTGTFWQHYKNKKYSPVNLYAATKEAFETVAAYYLETTKINFVTIKLSDTFGPGDTRPKIVNLLSKISKSGETLEMSPGRQLLDISFIEDITAGYLKVVELLGGKTSEKFRGKTFAMHAKKQVSLRELVATFEKVTMKKLNILWGAKEYREREVMTPWRKGETIPGWNPKTSLEEAIKRTIEA